MRRRGEVIDYVREKYGRDCVANIITYGTLGAKMALRDIARVNNLLDKKYTLNYGYNTDGANFFVGVRYAPGK